MHTKEEIRQVKLLKGKTKCFCLIASYLFSFTLNFPFEINTFTAKSAFLSELLTVNVSIINMQSCSTSEELFGRQSSQQRTGYFQFFSVSALENIALRPLPLYESDFMP